MFLEAVAFSFHPCHDFYLVTFIYTRFFILIINFLRSETTT